MSEGWFVLLGALAGALIGGIASFFGTYWSAQYQAKIDRERRYRERLQENIYALQNALEEVVVAYSLALEISKDNYAFPRPQTREITTSLMRLNMRSGRVGDDILAKKLSAGLELFRDARVAENAVEANELFNKGISQLKPAFTRMGELLHTDAKVDLGISPANPADQGQDSSPGSNKSATAAR